MRRGGGALSERVIVSVIAGLLIVVSLLPVAAQADDDEPDTVQLEFACSSEDVLCSVLVDKCATTGGDICVSASVTKDPTRWTSSLTTDVAASTAFNWCTLWVGWQGVPYLTPAASGDVSEGPSGSVDPGCPVGDFNEVVHLVEVEETAPQGFRDRSPFVAQCPADLYVKAGSVTVEEDTWWPCPA